MPDESDLAEFDSDHSKGDLQPTSAEGDNLDPTLAPDSSLEDSAATKMPELAGYELVEELGRGGMGVVYRARHLQLDRPVAIKMILAGQFASPESVQRFQLEAETAARLDHPGIVPIYEIGKVGDHRFFSMKLIDGEPLSERLDEYQPDQRKSVALMIQVAAAVQHAHQRGVLHRDLKPANVLIDGEGQPLLTDLGLAKQLDNDGAITQTGLVLGSPGFMSPEQAAGQTDVTIAADVYAMGAILYWMVSGRAPITGKNVLEVVQKTIEHEPESVRDLRADADRDLNLICMKALQKSPDDRYSSADAFAGDLQAWLDGEPLSVKPPTAITWMRRWVRKNFRGVSVGVCTGTLCGFALGFIILLQIANGQLEAATELHERLEASNPPWITSQFAWVQKIPGALREILPISITLIVAICGIATIGLSKPKPGESGLAAGLTASLLAGILAFVISWAWAPIANRTQRAARQDLQLLSDHLFMHPDDRHLAEEILFRRYPGLPKANSWKRSDLLMAKISSDQTSRIPGGIWIGLIVTGFVSTLPLMVCCALAGVIWHRDYRGWGFFWRSLEIGFYVTTLTFLLCRSFGSFTGPPPAWHLQLLSTVLIITAIAVALRCRSFGWRFPMFLIVCVASVVNLADSSNVGGAHWQANGAVTDAELADSATYLERQLADGDNRYRRYQLATLYAYLGDDEKYVGHCNQLLTDGNFHRRNIAEQTAKVVLLRPELHDDLTQAHLLARWASEQRGFNAWDYLVRALSEYRQGHASEALQWSKRCRETAESQNNWQKEIIMATALVVDALAYQLQGDDVKQPAARQQAEQMFDAESEMSFETKLTYRLLLSELELRSGESR